MRHPAPNASNHVTRTPGRSPCRSPGDTLGPVRRSLRVGAVALLCCLACSFDSTGGVSGSSLGLDADTTSGSTSEPKATSEGPGGSTTDDDATTTSTATTSTATTSATTDDATSDATTNTSREGDSTGAETTGPGFEPYGMCPCIDGQESCVDFEVNDVTISNVCYWLVCSDQGDCPQPSTGTATPICASGFPNGGCGLDCSGGASCPSGMMCYEIWTGTSIVDRCAWPT